MSAASDRNAAQLVFQSLRVLITDYLHGQQCGEPLTEFAQIIRFCTVSVPPATDGSNLWRDWLG